jgi:hypothetical protein
MATGGAIEHMNSHIFKLLSCYFKMTQDEEGGGGLSTYSKQKVLSDMHPQEGRLRWSEWAVPYCEWAPLSITVRLGC